MLGKLIKYDLRYGSRTLLAACGAVFVFIAAYPRLLTWQNSRRWGSGFIPRQPDAVDTAVAVLNVIMPLALTGLAFVAFVLLIQLFNKGLYSDEGYLMHTLPVTPWALVGSKVITTTVWFLAAALALFLGALIGFEDFATQLVRNTTAKELGEAATVIAYTLSSFLSGLTLIYFCITLARLMVQRGVLLVAICVGIGINLVGTVINAILFNASNMAQMSMFAGWLSIFALPFMGMTMANYGGAVTWTTALWMSAGYNLLWSGLYYALTVLCMGRRIRLR